MLWILLHSPTVLVDLVDTSGRGRYLSFSAPYKKVGSDGSSVVSMSSRIALIILVLGSAAASKRYSSNLGGMISSLMKNNLVKKPSDSVYPERN